MYWKRLSLLAVALAAAVSTSSPAVGGELTGPAEADRIRAIRAEFNEAIAAHDASRIASFIDDTYQITTGAGRHYRETPEEDASAWAEIFAATPDIVYIRNTEHVSVSEVQPLSAENGSWVGRWTAPGGKLEMRGTYFAQWRNVDGAWKIRAEIFVTLDCQGPGCGPATSKAADENTKEAK